MHALFGVVLVTEGGDSSVPPYGLVGYLGRGRRAGQTTKGACPGTWEALRSTRAGGTAKQAQASEAGVQGVRVTGSTGEGGEPAPRGPVGGKRSPGHGIEGRKDDRKADS